MKTKQLIALYDDAWLVTHVQQADKLLKQYRIDNKHVGGFHDNLVLLSTAKRGAYRRNRMRTFQQWNNNLDWNDKHFVHRPFNPKPVAYKYKRGRLLTRK